MRGLILPSKKDVIDWGYARNRIDMLNGHKFLEALVMGRSRQVYAHLIVPTCLCLFFDVARNREMARVISQQRSNLDVLVKQDTITTACAFCSVPLSADNLRPYQVAVRLIGATDDNAKTWTYDTLLGVLCRACETKKWRSLLPITEADYLGIAQVISDHGFTDAISVEKFIDADRFGPDPFEVASMALIESYLARLCLINKRTAIAILAIKMDQSDAAVCGHCGNARHEDIVECGECGAVSFCTVLSTDKRMGADYTCFELAQIYHGLVCAEIRKGHLFYLEDACYITRGKAGLCIPFFSKEAEEEEDESSSSSV